MACATCRKEFCEKRFDIERKLSKQCAPFDAAYSAQYEHDLDHSRFDDTEYCAKIAPFIAEYDAAYDAIKTAIRSCAH